MVLYFSATGNSKLVADYISEILTDDCICLNGYLRSGEKCVFKSDEPFIFIAPIYAWRFPASIEELIRKAKLSGNRKIYFIGTMESQAGSCGKHLRLIADHKKMEYMGFKAISMPSNYILGRALPDEAEALQIIKRAVPHIEAVCDKISACQELDSDKGQFLGSICSGLINAAFNKLFISSRGYRVSDACISCGLCERICPVGNIVLRGKVPEFGRECIGCYGCINRCPSNAIDIGNITVGRRRYVCPQYDDIREVL